MELSAKCGICDSTFYASSDSEYKVTNMYEEWKKFHEEKCISLSELEGGEQECQQE